jgi:hypothetical protein
LGLNLANFEKNMPSFGESSARIILVKNLCNDATNPLRNPKENTMGKLYQPAMMTGYMVDFLDTLMSTLDSKIAKLNKNERREVISLFLENSGCTALTQSESSDDVAKTIEKIYDAMESGRPNEQRCLSMALRCLSERMTWSAGDKWHYFATFLAKTYADERIALLRFLVAMFRTIVHGLGDPPLFTVKSKRLATVMFTLETIMRVDVERCVVRHCSEAELKSANENERSTTSKSMTNGKVPNTVSRA